LNEIESAATSAEKPESLAEPPDLGVRLAHELIEKARRTGVSLVGPDGLLAGVTRTVLQAALDTEMTEHLGYEKGDRTGARPGNHRNGSSPKTVRTEVGPVTLAVPRDRNVRAADRAQACPPGAGLRRGPHQPLRQGSDHWRDRRAPGRDLWHPGVSRADLQGLMRPCLEDLLQLFVEEFKLDAMPTARQAIEDGRVRWRRRQLAATVRDDPEEAARVLRELGYDVVPPPAGPISPRLDRLARW
jgi:hypothetical protein